MVDVAVSRMMGLVVVARLANRHGVKVELRPADTERGTVADVGLPASVLVPRRSPAALPAGATAFGGGRADRAGRSSPSRWRWRAAPRLPRRPAVRPEPADAVRWHARHADRPFRAGLVRPDRRAGQRRPVRRHERRNERLLRHSAGPAAGFSGRDTCPAAPADGMRMDGRRRSAPPSRASCRPTRRATAGRRSAARVGAAATAVRRAADAVDAAVRRQPAGAVRAAGSRAGVRAAGRPADVRAADVRAADVAPMSGRRSWPPAPSGAPMSGPPAAAPPSGLRFTPHGPGPQGYPAGAMPAASAPPAWPPVADRIGPPAVPESLAAALDMTAELPRYRPDRSPDDEEPDGVRPQSPAPADEPPAADEPPSEAQRAAAAAAAAHEAAAAQAAEAQATAAAQIAAAQAAARQRDTDGQFADETMELPIFRELESAWFTTARPHSDTARAARLGPSAVSAAATQRLSDRRVRSRPARPELAMDGEGSPRRRRRSGATAPAPARGRPRPTRAGRRPGPRPSARRHAPRRPGCPSARRWHSSSPAASTGAGTPSSAVPQRRCAGCCPRTTAGCSGVAPGQSTNPEDDPGGQQSSQAGKEHDA